MVVTLSLISQDEKHILQNLYSLYLHDLSEFTDGLEISSDGSFQFDSFDLIWESEGLTPYFIENEKNVLGFLLLLERPFLKKEYDYSINDLFILNKYRGKGVTKSLIKALFKQKQGKYFLVVLKKNVPALSFWRRVLSEFNINFEEENKIIDEEECLVITF